MKRLKKLHSTLLLAIAMVMTMQIPAFAAENPRSQKEIYVTGTGVVSVTPNQATIQFGVETNEKTAQSAQSKNASIVQKAVSNLISQGIAEKDIVTNYTSLYPKYHYDEKKEKNILMGYRAYTSFQITTKDIENVGKYLDCAIQSGVTNNEGVNFSLSDPNDYYSQALKSALKNATSNANEMVSYLGYQLGEPIQITEHSSPSSYVEEAYDNMAPRMMQKETSTIMDIRYDKIQISANIEVLFAYDNK